MRLIIEQDYDRVPAFCITHMYYIIENGKSPAKAGLFRQSVALPSTAEPFSFGAGNLPGRSGWRALSIAEIHFPFRAPKRKKGL